MQRTWSMLGCKEVVQSRDSPLKQFLKVIAMKTETILNKSSDSVSSYFALWIKESIICVRSGGSALGTRTVFSSLCDCCLLSASPGPGTRRGSATVWRAGWCWGEEGARWAEGAPVSKCFALWFHLPVPKGSVSGAHLPGKAPGREKQPGLAERPLPWQPLCGWKKKVEIETVTLLPTQHWGDPLIPQVTF